MSKRPLSTAALRALRVHRIAFDWHAYRYVEKGGHVGVLRRLGG